MERDYGMLITLTFAGFFGLLVASGFYAMTNLPYADVIRSWWM